MLSVIKSNGYSMRSMKLRGGVAFIVFILNLWSVSLADARVHGGQEPCGVRQTGFGLCSFISFHLSLREVLIYLYIKIRGLWLAMAGSHSHYVTGCPQP